MTFEEILKLCFSLEQLGPWAVSAAGAAGTAVWLAYKTGKSSMREAVELSKLSASHEKQRSIAFSEDLATAKQTLNNREARLVEVERQVTKSELDFKTLAQSRPDDTHLQKNLLLIDELNSRIGKFDQLRNALLGPEEELWKLRGASPTVAWATALKQSSARVLVVANLKGGVGKTTITTNLALPCPIQALISW